MGAQKKPFFTGKDILTQWGVESQQLFPIFFHYFTLFFCFFALQYRKNEIKGDPYESDGC